MATVRLRQDVMVTQEMLNAVIVLAACLLLSGITYLNRMLDAKASLLGFFMGLVVGIFGHVLWLLLLLAFLITGFCATRYKYAYKKKLRVAEGKTGERRFGSVLANGWVPMVVAVLSVENPLLDTFPKSIAAVLFLSAISSAASDTIASELGVLSDKVYMITNFRRVKPGINGGVSAIGTVAAFGAAVYISLMGWAVLILAAPSQLTVFPPHFILIPVLMGFTGCQIDSVMGALLENRGYLNKDRVNILSIGFATMGALAMLKVMGA